MNTPANPPHQTDPARRRLLRGSFSAPAVLALTSGSALAAQSATCLAKATASPSTAPMVSGSSLDTLMRVRLRKRDNNNVHFVARSDLGALPIALSLWGVNTLWQRFGVLSTVPAEFNMFYGNQQTNSVPANVQVDLYVAMRFDAGGNVVGMGLSGTGSVVGSSCWTSIKTV
ncbi:MAG TPA: hypothetical protein PLA97_03140 [Rubrivivax sp.]|nr:hypothetical protein [Rubrivivax sp.]